MKKVLIVILIVGFISFGFKRAANPATATGNGFTKKEKQELAKKSKITKVELVNQYIEKYKRVAIKEQKLYGIPASITLAQGILESNAGQSSLSAKCNNHFGMKWIKGRKEKYAIYADDSPTDKFVVYKSAWWSYRDHSKLLMLQRYKPCRKCNRDYECWARQLKKCGYATAPHYAKCLISIIKQYKLYKYDV
jgi:flagellum-specific peptidoglycan hydrolase FlgJ